jgi:hypothetical protein
MLELFWRAVAWIVTRERISQWLMQRAARTPYSDIYDASGKLLYMRRWWLFNPYEPNTYLRQFKWLPISVRIHHIVRPDSDRHLHDHPWGWRTIILAGNYTEERESGIFVRTRGDTSGLAHNEFHRIDHVDAKLGAVTLFITFRYRHRWGFKVNYREYLGIPEA